MIRMSKLADYSFIILTQIVRGDGGAWAASDLADKSGLPAPTVAKIMKLLAKNGVVLAQRGASGGYQLASPANSISVASIIEAIDGPIALTACVDEAEPDCLAHQFCPLHGGWDKVNLAVRGALQNVTLADMVSDSALCGMQNMAPLKLGAASGN